MSIFFCLFAVAYSAPRLTNENQCAQKCSNSQDNFRYEVGKTYVYDYDSWTKINLKDEEGPDVQIQGTAKISVLRPCELALQLSDVRVRGPVDGFEYKRTLEMEPILFSFDEGRIQHVCASDDDQTWAVNLKKGLISSLQVGFSSLEGSSIVRESDILGECETKYEASSRSGSRVTIRKTKDMKTCGQRHQSVAALFPKSYSSPDFAIQNMPIMSNDYSCDIVVDRDLVMSSRCTDKNSFIPLTLARSGSHMMTQIQLQFVRVLNGIQIAGPRSYAHESLLFAANPMESQMSESEVRGLLQEMCPLVTDDIRPEVPAKFAQLVQSLRRLPEASVARLWTSVKSICDSDKLRDLFADALIMDASEGSMKILTDLILKKSVSPITSNYWLTMLAFVNRPTQESIMASIPLIEQSNPPRQALLGVSAMIHNFCVEKNCENNNVVQRAVNAIAKNIGSRCKATDKSQAIVALKSLENIGQIESAFDEVLSCLNDHSIDNSVQVAAIESLHEMVLNDDQKAYERLVKVFSTYTLDPEVRIAAYRMIVKSSSENMLSEVLRVLRDEKCEQVGSYVTTHLKNVQTSSDPQKQTLRDLIRGQNIEDKFEKNILKFSRNMELSYLLEKMNFGGVLDSDIIYDHNFAPRSLKLNLTIPVFGKSINFFEVGVRQVGLEKQLEEFAGPRGFLSRDGNVPEMFQDLVNFFRVKGQDAYQSAQKSGMEIMRNHRRHLSGKDQPEIDASMYLKFDGKTVFYVDMSDAEDQQENVADMINNYKDKFGVKSFLNQDAAMSFMFLDSEHQFPAANGMPLKLKLNGTVVMGYKGENNAIWPSFAMEVSAKMGFDVHDSQPGLRWVNSIHSAPAIRADIEYKNDRPVRMTVSMPKEKLELFTYKSDVKLVNSRNQEKSLHAHEIREMNGCSQSVLGVKVCGQVVTPKPFFNLSTPVLPLNGAWEVEVTLDKIESSQKGWEMVLEIPSPEDDQKTFKVGFNTPGSSEDREVSLEVQLDNQGQGSNVARVTVKSPMKNIEAIASQTLSDSEMSAQAELTIDQEKQFSVEAGILRLKKGRKTEYQPKFSLTMKNREPKTITGSLTLDQGRRSQMAFRLQDQSRNEIVRGSLIKDGDLSVRNPFRLSSDVRANLGFVNFRVFGSSERSETSFSSDVSVEYQLPNERSQKVKFVSKVQNLSTRSLTKLTSFLEVQMSALPQYNLHVNWNLLFKPNEHLENEAIIMWGKQFRDQSKKIKLLQVSKFSGLNGQNGDTKSADNVISIEIPPMNINYMIEVNSLLRNGELPKLSFEVVANEKQQRKEYRTSFDYNHISKKPLKMTFESRIKYPGRDMRYMDEINEVRPNEFKGQSTVQWQTGRQAKTDYVYRVKSNSDKVHHEFDLSFNHPSLAHPIQHQGLLRMTRDEFELNSKLNHEGQSVWDAQSVLSKRGKSQIVLDTKKFTGKVESNPWSVPSVSNIDFVSKTKPYHHNSNVQVDRDSVTLNSRTVVNEKPMLVLNSHLSKKSDSRITFETEPFDASMKLTRGQGPVSGRFEVRSKKSSDAHKTTFDVVNGKLNIQSKTKFNGRDVANVQAHFEPRDKSSVTLETPRFVASAEGTPMSRAKFEVLDKQSRINHNTEMNLDSDNLKVLSRTERQDQPILTIDANLSKNKASYALVEGEQLKGRFDVNPFGYQKTSSLRVQDKTNALNEHSTEVMLHPKAWTISSKTVGDGKPILSFEGKFKQPLDNQLSFEAPQGEVQWEINSRQAKLHLSHKQSQVEHISEVRRRNGRWTLSSKTHQRGNRLALVNGGLDSNGGEMTVESPFADVNVELKPWKSGLVQVSGQSPIFHRTSVDSDRDSVMIRSQTRRDSKTLMDLDSTLSKSKVNRVKLDVKPWSASMEVDPWSSIKSSKIEINEETEPIAHVTEAKWGRNKLQFDSNTQVKGRQVMDFSSKFHPSQKSFAKLTSKPLEALVQFDNENQVKSGRLSFKRDQLEHLTSFETDPEEFVAIKSNTECKRECKCFLNVDTKIHPRSDSHLILKMNSPMMSGEFKGLHSMPMKSLKLSMQNPDFEHLTNIEYKPREKIVTFESNTNSNGDQIASIKSRLTRDEKSDLSLDFKPIRASLEVNPNSYQKTLKYDVHHRNSDLLHSAQVSYEPENFFIVNSIAQQQGEPLFNLNSDIRQNRPSSIQLEVPQFEGKLDLSPFSRTKTAKFALTGKTFPHEHNSDITYQHGQSFEVNSRTMNRGRKIALVNLKMSHYEPSNLNVESQLLDAQVKVNPFGPIREGLVIVKGNQIPLDHTFNCQVSPKHFNLKTNTAYEGQNILDLDSSLSMEKPSFVKCNNGLFDGHFEVDPQQNKVRVNYLAKHGYRNRRILGSTQLKTSPKKQLDFDIKWDADNDQEQRVKFSADADDSSYDRNSYNINGQLGSNRFIIVKTKMGQDLVKGPHDIEVEFKVPRHPVNIIVHHDIQGDEMNCVFRYLRDRKEMIEVTNVAKLSNSRGQHLIESDMKVNSVYKYLDKTRFHVKNVIKSSRRENSMKSQLDIQIPGLDSPYQVESDLLLKDGEFDAQMKCLTPIYDYKKQEMSFNSKWSSESLLIKAMIAALGKKAALNSDMKMIDSGFESKVTVESDFELIPSLNMFGKMVNDDDQKQIKLSAEMNQEKMIDVQGDLKFGGLQKFNAKLDANSKWTPKYRMQASGQLNQDNLDYQIAVDEDQKALVEVVVRGKRSGQGLDGDAKVSGFGSEFVNVNLKRSRISNGQSYTLTLKGKPIEPIRITYTASDDPSGLRRSFRVCSSKSVCRSAEATFTINGHYEDLDQTATVLLKGVDHVVKVDWVLKNINQKLINKMMVDYNGQNVGYNFEADQSRVIAQVFTPERQFEVRGATWGSRGIMKVRIDLLTDAQRSPKSKLTIEVVHKDVQSRNSRKIQTQVTLSHPVWQRPLVSSFEMTSNDRRPFAAQIELDLTSDPNEKIFVEANVLHPSGDMRNTSIQINARKEDRQAMDIGMEAHLGFTDDKMTTGLQWRWMNRRKENVQGFYFVSVDAKSQQIQLISRCPMSEIEFEGEFEGTQNDALQMGGQVRVNGIPRKVQMEILDERPCVRFTTQGKNEQEKKYEVCLESSVSEIFKLSGKSLTSGHQSDDMKVAFYKQSDSVYRLHLKWNPEAFGQFVYAVAQAAEKVDFRMPEVNYNEIPQEMNHKWSSIKNSIYNDVIVPSDRSLTSEMQRIQEDLNIDDEFLQPVKDFFSQMTRFTSNLLSKLIPDSIVRLYENMMQSLSQKLTEACAYESLCYSMAYKYQRSGWTGVRQEFTEMVKESTENLMQSWGSSDIFASTKQFGDKMSEKIRNSPLMNELREMTADAIEFIEKYLTKIIQKVDDKLTSIDRSLLESPEYSEAYKSVRQVGSELRTEMGKAVENVDWSRVSETKERLVNVLKSKDFWLSSARCLTWNPEDGEILIEFKPPVTPHTLKSIWTRDNSTRSGRWH